MKKRCILFCVAVLGMVLISPMLRSELPENSNLDGWIGEYEYKELYPYNEGPDYYTYHYITIWAQGNEYYALIRDEGWVPKAETSAWTLGYVSGDEKKIDIVALQTLAWDSLYGECERYKKGEALIHLEFTGQEIITEWIALRDQSPILKGSKDAIIGSYFEKTE